MTEVPANSEHWLKPEAQAIDSPEPQDSISLIETCTATKANGERCKSRPLKGDLVCLLHSPRADEVRATARQRSNEARAQKVEARQERVERAKLGSRERLAVLLAEKQDAVMTVLLDNAIRDDDRRTLLALFDQAYGKPTEHVEHTAGDPFQMDEAELRTWLDRAMQQDETVTETSMDTGIEGSGQAGGHTDSPDMPESS